MAKIIKEGPQCAIAYIENGQGRRLVAAARGRHEKVLENPATLATNKAELDRVIRIMQSLRDELPDG